jgi:thiamine-monophosphate kinase
VTDDRLGEFGRIARFFRPLAEAFPGAFGLADDAASIAVPPGRELVVTTDAIVSGVHFLPSDRSRDIARKALRVNLSDLAAKGSSPLAYTLTLALDRTIKDRWVEDLALALGEDQARYGITLAGGDSVSTNGPIWVSITAFGTVEAEKMVRRSGAQPGDLVLVTGTIGDAALGLRLLQGAKAADEAEFALLAERYRLPEPRTGLARAVAAHAHAAIDISDGLAADFGHVCVASGVTGLLETARLPLSAPARRFVEDDPALWPLILGGGDDYELLLTASPDGADKLEAAAAVASVSLTRVGRIESGAGRAVLLGQAGKEITLHRTGWTHG